jgi:3-methyladenine DNA glycosylase AlkD
VKRAEHSQSAGQLLHHLRAHSNRANLEGMARYGINTGRALGVPMPVLRRLARETGKSHKLAAQLWASGIHEARILATLVDELSLVTPRQLDRWARDFDSWDVCDQACQNLFRFTPFAFGAAAKWARAKPEFVRRAGFALMAGLAVKAKQATDAQFEAFLPLAVEAGSDPRNLVKKAVSWALRQMGKRNPRLRTLAMAAAEEIAAGNSPSARWIASDVLRELRARAASR